MPFLIGIIILISFILITYLYLRIKINKLLKNYGLISLKDILEQANLEDEEIPKSLSSMDSIYLERIKEDFPNININELKRLSEKIILEYFNAITKKDTKNIKNEKIKAYIDSKIINLKNSKVNYNNIKFHKTVISKYENNNKVATIYFSSSLQYIYNKDNERPKKIQDRFKLEFIYVVDAESVPPSQKVLGLNCPNCNSPIKSLKDKSCQYCQTPIIDIAKRVWSCNDIINY